MPLLTRQSFETIARLLFDHYSVDMPFYLIPNCYIAKFGSENNYMVKSEYSTLCATTIKPSIVEKGRFKPSLEEFAEKLLQEIRHNPAVDLVVAICESHDCWGAVENDVDGNRCLEKARSTTKIQRRKEDPFDSPWGAIAAAQEVGIAVGIIDNGVPCWDPREDSNDLDPNEY